ncbi:MAG: 4-(cytidine 5'-diphospho)-2-C-methyl-D-erythritol kinase [Oscillospiraceae bacterium]|nr:4-(cytidine 5'-diphospho)-2-C-methyl-D-erythritol kinase [Oscillospiraceae bacterium]MBR2890669.1 4-(cytidine 5'-diphospho)-2-C-methyl-D-erythritol kinase [Oscillospiraceae bacterium]
MTTLYEGAFAKLNLTLDVLDKREDGYHNLQSVMQTVSIRDDIEIDVGTGKPWTLACDREGIPCDSSNLAWKAAEVFQEFSKKDLGGIAIRITKRIPSQAGMGGGSADAAAVLRALNAHFDYPFSIMALAELGAQVGSDVPFCVLCGTAMVEGRGERLRKLPDMPKDCVIVVCKPDFGVSTPELYRKIDQTAIAHRPDNRAMESALLEGDLGKVCAQIYNVFDPLVTEEHLEMNYIKSIMNSYGAIGFQMTGSGSAIFAVMPNFEYAAVVCNMLKENYPEVYICMPV